jgi:prepilin-type N-terminal cleavage/methylation domain-containing protein/prepilin-type processing-associated H-X9-DG protein
MSISNRKRGFTLIELLVIIAIISILAAILFPVFARARENARRASCISNLKQMGLGVMMYVQDYDGHFPYSQMTMASMGLTSSQVPGYADFVGSSVVWEEQTYPYVKSTQIYYCPSRPFTGGGFYGNYGANRIIMPKASEDHYAAPSEATLTFPAQTYLAMDAGIYILSPANVKAPIYAGIYLPGTGPGSFANLTATNQSSFSSGALDDFKSGRHFGGVNVCFADGHVKWLKTEIVYKEAVNYNGSTHAASAWDPQSTG